MGYSRVGTNRLQAYQKIGFNHRFSPLRYASVEMTKLWRMRKMTDLEILNSAAQHRYRKDNEKSFGEAVISNVHYAIDS